MTALESQSTHTGQQIQALTTQLTLLTDELLLQRCIYQPQSLLLLLIIIAVAVSVPILFCNRGSTPSNTVSLGRVGGGRGFLTRHLRSTSQDDDPQTSPPPTTTEQLPPSRDSLTPTSHPLLNFLSGSLVNSTMYRNDCAHILGPGVPVVRLHYFEQHLSLGVYPISIPRLLILDHAPNSTLPCSPAGLSQPSMIVRIP